MSNQTNPKQDINSIIKGKLSNLGERIRIAILPMSQRDFATIWKGSVVTINRYITGKTIPNIQDLAEIAELTNTDLLWLLTGQDYSQRNPHWLAPNQSIEICPDNSMTPTFGELAPVIIEAVETEQPLHNGVYCIEVTQGIAFRRLQWDEEKQGFWLRCDNLHFEPQFSQAPKVMGKVVGAVMPVL